MEKKVNVFNKGCWNKETLTCGKKKIQMKIIHLHKNEYIIKSSIILLYYYLLGFPGGAIGKESAC